MTNKTILDISSFGGTAAEDDDLKRFFVRTPAFEQIWGGDRNIVIGRKGSGKTALYLALQDRAIDEGRRCAGLSFSQYPWQAHHKYAVAEVTKTERFVESWRFLILAEALSMMVDRPADGLTRQQAIALGQVEKFLSQNYGTTNFDFRKAFPSGGLRLEALEAAPEAGGVSGGSATWSRNPGEGLGRTLGRINEWLFAKAQSMGSNFGPTYVLFDELDLGFDPEDDDYRDRVIGLLLAARRFVSDSRRFGVDIRPVVFLRSDIFDRLKFGDKNKVRTANTVELLWHDRLDHTDASLKHLIDWRIKETLGVSRVGEAWDAAFDPQLTRGRQHKFQHITFRTLLRPRDVIQFCNLALKRAQTRLRSASDAPRLISNEDLKAARDDYSTYFRLEFDDEIGEAFPDWDGLLEILRSIGSARFTSEDCANGYKTAAKKTKLEWDEAEVLPFLYEYSIIGFEKTRPTGSGLTHHFKYQGETISFDPDASSFLVHRGLKEALDLTETN